MHQRPRLVAMHDHTSSTPLDAPRQCRSSHLSPFWCEATQADSLMSLPRASLAAMAPPPPPALQSSNSITIYSKGQQSGARLDALHHPVRGSAPVSRIHTWGARRRRRREGQGRQREDQRHRRGAGSSCSSCSCPGPAAHGITQPRKAAPIPPSCRRKNGNENALVHSASPIRSQGKHLKTPAPPDDSCGRLGPLYSRSAVCPCMSFGN